MSSSETAPFDSPSSWQIIMLAKGVLPDRGWCSTPPPSGNGGENSGGNTNPPADPNTDQTVLPRGVFQNLNKVVSVVTFYSVDANGKAGAPVEYQVTVESTIRITGGYWVDGVDPILR
jgi:D-tyrosyl-tRNA(Tyr) deacylase